MKYLVILFAFFLTACASKPKYDLSALHSFDPKAQNEFLSKNHLKYPFTSSFHTGNKELMYLAIDHAGDINSPTFTLIKKSIEHFKPDVILVEGVGTKEGYSPKRVIDKAKKCLPDWNNCVEILYAAHLAETNNIKFIGSEPSDEYMFTELESQGYSVKDIAFFYLSRQMQQAYDPEKRIKSWNDIKVQFHELLSLTHIYENSHYSFDEYIAWLKEKTGHNVTFKEIVNSKFTDPIKNGNYIQRLSNTNVFIRDKHVLQVILNHMQKHKKILVIFGFSHYPLQKDVLEKYLGKPSYIQH